MAVYTKVSEQDAAELLRAYAIGDLVSLAGIKKGVENSNYLLTTTQDKYILTLYEKRTKAEDLPFFMGLLEHLAAQEIPCPRPVAGKDSLVLRQLCGRSAALVTFLDGRSSEVISPPMCSEVGRWLARLHLAGRNYSQKRPNSLQLAAWCDLFHKNQHRADQVQVELAQKLESELEFLKTHWPQDLPAGVIHADLFADNVFFDDEKLCGLIDFYFACTDFFAYDLAITLNAWCFEHDVAFNITKARALMRGYESLRPLAMAERTSLTVLMRGASIRFLLTRLHDWLSRPADVLVKAKDPLEYLTRLQFHQQIKSLSAYGLSE